MIDRCKSTKAVKPNLKPPKTRRNISTVIVWMNLSNTHVFLYTNSVILIQTNISMSPCTIIESSQHFWLSHNESYLWLLSSIHSRAVLIANWLSIWGKKASISGTIRMWPYSNGLTLTITKVRLYRNWKNFFKDVELDKKSWVSSIYTSSNIGSPLTTVNPKYLYNQHASLFYNLQNS